MAGNAVHQIRDADARRHQRQAMSRLKTRLRLLIPAPAKPAAKAVRRLVDPIVIRRYRAASGDARPIPPSTLRARSGRPGIGLFFESARRSSDELEAALAAAGHSLSDFQLVLDFGCGCGRILQELSSRNRRGSMLFGCDVDEEAVDWASVQYGDLHLTSTSFSPPLPYPDAKFDLVYSSSVFTHLDADAQLAWLHEFERVLSPGGLALISVYGEDAFQRYRSGDLLGVSRNFRSRLGRHESLAKAGVIFEPYAGLAWNNFNFSLSGKRYGITFDGETYVRTEWSKVLDVIAVFPRSWWYEIQDLVLLSKPSAESPSVNGHYERRQLASAHP